MENPDPIIHDASRLRIVMVLSGAGTADFNFLRSTLQITNGNLSSHMSRLESAGYVAVEKSFRGKVPHTAYRLTKAGRKAVAEYWAMMDAIRGGAGK